MGLVTIFASGCPRRAASLGQAHWPPQQLWLPHRHPPPAPWKLSALPRDFHCGDWEPRTPTGSAVSVAASATVSSSGQILSRMGDLGTTGNSKLQQRIWKSKKERIWILGFPIWHTGPLKNRHLATIVHTLPRHRFLVGAPRLVAKSAAKCWQLAPMRL